MKNADPRGASGTGFFPCQAHEKAYTDGGGIAGRAAMFGYRMIDIPRGLDNPRHEEGTIGDLQGFFLWQKTTRPLPVWREAVPARSIKPHVAGDPPEFGLPGGEKPYEPPFGDVPGMPRVPSDPVTPAPPPAPTIHVAEQRVTFPWPSTTPYTQAQIDGLVGIGLALFKKDHPTAKILSHTYFVNGYNLEVVITIRYSVPATPDDPTGPGTGPGTPPGGDPPDSYEPGAGDPGGEPSGPDDGPELELLPIGGSAYNPDSSFQKMQLPRPAGWQKFPVDYYFAVTACTDALSQIVFAGSVDPRLVAVNAAGGAGCGTFVYDTDKDSRFDLTRGARLHSAFRVLRAPAFSGETSANFGNALALQFGRSGRGDAPGGYAIDGGKIGFWSWRRGGCLSVGSGRTDKHRMGQDADGHAINPMHIHTGACFTVGGGPSDTSSVFDGPMHFETSWPNPTDKTPYVNLVHMGWDPQAAYAQIGGGVLHGKWKWWTTSPMSVSTPSTPSPPVRPRPPFDPMFGAFDPTGDADPVAQYAAPASFSTIQKINSFITSASRQYAVMAHELAGPGWLARPQRYVAGEPDTRYSDGQTADAVANLERTSPITARLSAFGAQGGKVGGPNVVPTSGGTQQPTPWDYTQEPGSSRYPSGSANGGLVLTPPEVDLSDADDNLAPSGLALSTTYLVMGRGAALAFGMPELATGGVRNGWSANEAGAELYVYSHDSVGTKTQRLRLATTLLTLADGLNIELDIVTGTQIGTGATQKLGFYGATPIVRGALVADAAGGGTVDAEARTAVNTVLARLRALGVITT